MRSAARGETPTAARVVSSSAARSAAACAGGSASQREQLPSTASSRLSSSWASETPSSARRAACAGTAAVTCGRSSLSSTPSAHSRSSTASTRAGSAPGWRAVIRASSSVHRIGSGGQLHHVAHERRDAQVEDVAVLVAARHGWSLREGQPPPDDDRRRVQVDAEPPADVGAGLGLTKQAGEPLDVRLGS